MRLPTRCWQNEPKRINHNMTPTELRAAAERAAKRIAESWFLSRDVASNLEVIMSELEPTQPAEPAAEKSLGQIAYEAQQHNPIWKCVHLDNRVLWDRIGEAVCDEVLRRAEPKMTGDYCSICKTSIWTNQSRVSRIEFDDRLCHVTCVLTDRAERAESERDDYAKERDAYMQSYNEACGHRDKAAKRVAELESDLHDYIEDRDQHTHQGSKILRLKAERAAIRITARYMGGDDTIGNPLTQGVLALIMEQLTATETVEPTQPAEKSLGQIAHDVWKSLAGKIGWEISEKDAWDDIANAVRDEVLKREKIEANADLRVETVRLTKKIAELEQQLTESWPDSQQRVAWQQKAEQERDAALSQVAQLEAELAKLQRGSEGATIADPALCRDCDGNVLKVGDVVEDLDGTPNGKVVDYAGLPDRVRTTETLGWMPSCDVRRVDPPPKFSTEAIDNFLESHQVGGQPFDPQPQADIDALARAEEAAPRGEQLDRLIRDNPCPKEFWDEVEDSDVYGGLYGRYLISKTNGQPVDPRAEYFVLRLDEFGDDQRHIQACRKAVLVYADSIESRNSELADDIRAKWGTGENPQPRANRQEPLHKWIETAEVGDEWNANDGHSCTPAVGAPLVPWSGIEDVPLVCYLRPKPGPQIREVVYPITEYEPTGLNRMSWSLLFSDYEWAPSPSGPWKCCGKAMAKGE